MSYKELFYNENEGVLERYELSKERIGLIIHEETIDEKYRDYFVSVAKFIEGICCFYEDESKRFSENANITFEELRDINTNLYSDILGDAYDESYANPDFAVKKLGEEYGKILCLLYTQIRGMIRYAYEYRLVDMTINMELFVEVYNLFENAKSNENKEELDKDDSSRDTLLQNTKEAIYYFISDYADRNIEIRTRENVDPDLDRISDLVANSNLDDLRYLFNYGEYISDVEIKTAQFINTLTDEEVENMAKTYVEGYRDGFLMANKPLHKKKCVSLYYNIGFERVVRKAILMFKNMGLSPVIWLPAVDVINRKTFVNGAIGTPANKQYDYDHRYDLAAVLDKALNDRRITLLEQSYEKYKDVAALMGGPAVIETWGEIPFTPVNKENAWALSSKQQKLVTEYASHSGQIIKKYIKGDERSFTIISFPVPSIGDNFDEIFKETVKINTLDKKLYKDIQQTIIDTLDKADHVRVVGKGNNKTYINVSMQDIKNPDKETTFENCLADVNIPLGEVFTSPKLEGTEGLLHVSSVYLNGLKYEDLSIEFADGCIKNYTCSNFDNEEDNKKYIFENVMFNHETLPIGEFAIGTNTCAYAMAKKYDILDVMPILIVEKMGPHFAVGDTCFSWEEEIKTYNPDGKEMIAKENTYSRKRNDNPMDAYFNCHTDITIPYEELGEIVAVTSDGVEIDIIRDGKFVLPGTDELNKYL